MNKLVEIDGRTIGPGHQTLVVAEAGINHNGSLDLAREMIAVAARCGADAVKFQAYHAEEFLSSKDLTYTYHSQGDQITESQYDMFKRNEFGRRELEILHDECGRHGVIFLCTATDTEACRALVEMGVGAIKVGSDDLVHHPMLCEFAKAGKPLILSTGMADLEEIRRTVGVIEKAGAAEIVLLHCTSMYPTPEDRANILCIETLHREFECPVGYSDHTFGISAAVGAIALGACLVERHFTLDRQLPGPDHAFSADPTTLAAMVQAVRTMEGNLGSADVRPTPEELDMRAIARRSVVARDAIAVGTSLTPQHFAYKRPGTGIAPMDGHLLLGRRTSRDLAAGELITFGVVE